MSLTPELLRNCVLEALKRNPPEQYLNLQIATAGAVGERGYPVQQQPHGRPPMLLREDERRFREAVWSLIIEGVLVIGMDDSNNQWPFLSLSEYGEDVVAAGRILPHDTTEPLDEPWAAVCDGASEHRGWFPAVVNADTWLRKNWS